MNRRSFLRFLGVAPIVAPMAAHAHAMESLTPYSGGFIGRGFTDPIIASRGETIIREWFWDGINRRKVRVEAPSPDTRVIVRVDRDLNELSRQVVEFVDKLDNDIHFARQATPLKSVEYIDGTEVVSVD